MEMKINLIAQSSNESIEVKKSGDVLTINGVEYDFSGIPDGATLPDAEQSTGCKWLCGDIDRVNGEIQLTMIHPCPYNATQDMLNSRTLDISADGVIELPYSVTPVESK
jgi:hypothetical protein